MVLLCVRVIQSGLCESLCRLHYYDFKHSLNVISFFWDTRQNEFRINLGIFQINYYFTLQVLEELRHKHMYFLLVSQIKREGHKMVAIV